MDELKPCPFCGEIPEMIHAVLKEYHSVNPEIICRECGYRIKAKNLAISIANSPKENCKFMDRQTSRIWNTRPAEDALKAENEELCSTISGMEKTIGRAEKVLGERNLLAAEVERIKSKLALVKKHIVDNRDALLFVMKSESSRANYCEYAFCESLIELINAPDTGKMEEN